PSAAATRPRVVIVGAGFGGLRAARALGNAPVDIVLVDRHNYHLFQPLLYQVATAGLEPEQIARPVRAILRGQRNLEFRMTEVTGLDASGKRIVTTEGPIGYDYLILAVGGETNYFGLAGVVRHGFGLKDVPEAIRIRNHVLHAFERAMLEPDAEGRRTDARGTGASRHLRDRRRRVPRSRWSAAADDGTRRHPDGGDRRRQHPATSRRTTARAVRLSRPGLARHHRSECRRRLHPRHRVHRVSG